MNELKERAAKAAKFYLERKGMDVLDEAWTKEGLAGGIDLVARDGDTIVFADVTVSTVEDGGFRECQLSREQAELLAASWLGEHPDEADIEVRFDHVALMVCGESRAFRKHHVNCLGYTGSAC